MAIAAKQATPEIEVVDDQAQNIDTAEEHTVSKRTIGDEPTDEDTLGFKPYVDAVADFLLADATRPPLTFSIEGEWGSGKSSFMRQLRKNLDAAGGLTVEFNPWRHDKEDALWAAFALHFIQEISKQLSFWQRWKARFRLLRMRYNWKADWLDWLKVWAFALAVLLLMPMAVALLWFKGDAGLLWLVQNIPAKGELPDAAMKWVTGLGGAGAIGGSLLALWGKVKSYLSNPLHKDLRKHLKSPDYAARISFVENFHRDFRKIVNAYVGKKQAFVFIDDLDRCDVPKAADLMQAINLMISGNPQLFFIIGMDREKVAAGLAVKFEKVMPYLSDYVAESDAELKTRNGLRFGYKFIEKFIQIPFMVPQPKADSMSNLLDLKTEQVQSPKKSAKRLRLPDFSGLFRRFQRSKSDGVNGELPAEGDIEVRDADLTSEQRAVRRAFRLKVSNDDSETMKQIVSWAAPFLDMNPRRVKQFINLFRLKVLIANETGLFDPGENTEPLTIEQLAKFVVISLKWPLFVRELEKRAGIFAAGKELQASLARYSNLTDLVNYRADSAPFNMSSIDVPRLLQASRHVRHTELWTEPVPAEDFVEGAEAPQTDTDYELEEAALKKVQESKPGASTRRKRASGFPFLYMISDLQSIPLAPLRVLNEDGTAIEKQVARTWNAFGDFIEGLSKILSIDVWTAVAVIAVESPVSGFARDGRLLIRFEVHQFWKYWGQHNAAVFNQHFKFNTSKAWLGHDFRESESDDWIQLHSKNGQAAEWQALEVARRLDDSAALNATSMGAPQIMGFHHKTIGYDSPQRMFENFQMDIRYQILGLFDFFDEKMIQALQTQNFVRFAAAYNGSGQAQNYGKKLKSHAEAFERLFSPPA